MARARELARGLAEHGILVASGGAVGIDAAAHVGALVAGRPTLALLASGLDAPYPARHRPLFDEIVTRGGALLTSFAPGVPPRRWQFPRRNELLAALADLVIVVESASASGSHYTAVAARRMGRGLAACPGTPGNEILLAQGAALVESVDDVLAALDGRPRRRTVALPPPDGDAARAYAALDPIDPRGAERVASLSGLPALVASRALCALELDGLALAVAGGRFIRAASDPI
jgi:DNA processing protein